MIALLLDTETTGLKDPIQPIEIAYIPVYNNLTSEPSQSFHQRYKPSKPIEFGAMATHHIVMEDLLDCPATGSFRLPIESQYLIGHNIDFDWGALGRPPIKRICTLALAREAYPQLDSHTLGSLMYALFGSKAREQIKGAHSALNDIRMNYEVFRRICKDLDIQFVYEAHSRSEEARIPKKMPFGKHKDTPIEEVPYSYMTWCLRQPEMDPYVIVAFKRHLAKGRQ
jgi:exodeoxyribonuclease X